MKKISKKIILSVILIIAAIAVQAIICTNQVRAEVKSGEVKEMKWSFDTESGTLDVSGDVKAYSDFYEALEIDPGAVKTVKVGKDVEYFGFNLDKCKNLTAIELENEKTDRSGDVVYYCSNLTTVKHGENVVEKYDASSKTLTISGKGALNSAFIPYVKDAKIETIKIEDGITEIGERVKFGLGSVTKVTFPNTLKAINGSAFSGAGITSLELPDSVEKIGSNCFDGCTELKEIKLSSGLDELPTQCFMDCDSLEEVTIPKNVTDMAPSAFSDCEKLTKMTIENAECEISSYFDSSNIENLTELKMGDIQYKFDKESGTLEVSGGKKIVNANSATRAFGQLVIKSLIVKGDVEEIGDECFNKLSKVEKVELPDSLKVIGEKCFQGLESLSEIELSKNIEKIGKDSFKDCEKLTIKTEEDSVAYEYAEDNDIDVKATKKSKFEFSGAIIGIIIGCVVALILFIVLIVAIILVIKSKKKKQATAQN